MKPTWTAAGMNRDTNPSRRIPSTTKATPHRMASADDRGASLVTSPSAMAPTNDAEMAAVDDVGLTMSCRQVPMSP